MEAAVRAAASVRRPRIRAWTATLVAPQAARRLAAARQRLMIRANRLHRQRPAIPIPATGFVAGNGMARHGRWSHQHAQNSVRAMRSHPFRGLRSGRCSRSAVRLPWVAVKSSATNGICRSKVLGCVSRRSKKRCTWSRSAPAAGNGQTSSIAGTSRS